MSSPLAIANAAVAVHSDSNAPAVSASSAANASLCMKSPHRPAPQPAIGRLPYAPGAGGRPISNRGGRRLAPPASERPGRDHRNLGPSAGSSLSLRARPRLQAGGRACVSAYLSNFEARR